MATDDDDTLRRGGKPRLITPSEIINEVKNRAYQPERHRSHSYGLEAELATPEQDYSPPPKTSDPLPKPGDPYRACARFLNRLSGDSRLIHFVKADFTCEGFAYSDLRRLRWLPASNPGSGPVLVLRFMEAEITDVRVEGNKLDDVHYYISEGTMPWVWEQPPGFKVRDTTAPVIARITISKVER